MAFCLPRNLSSKFMDAIRSSELDPNKLADLPSSEARRAELAKYVGEENAHDVNAALENKMLLKDQQAGFVTWVKQTGGMTPKVERDLLSRIERMDKFLNPADEKAFLADAVAQKLGATATADEARTISAGAKNVQDLRAKIEPGVTPKDAPERMQYGLALDDYHAYMNHLMGKDRENIADLLKDKKFGRLAVSLAAASKGMQSSMDLSALLRQGFKMLTTHPIIWTRDAVKMFGDVGRQLKGVDAMRLIRADILSRDNALNGKYKAMGADVGVDFEEQFPSAFPEHIPIYGRLYKASETAFNGLMLQLRADLADLTIDAAEGSGKLDMLNPDQAKPIGELVNSMTGRGTIAGLTPGGHKVVNALLYSIKFLKSNYDTLTGHSFGLFVKDPAARRFLQQQAAKNLAKIAMVEAGILGTAYLHDPNSTSLDPRSSMFGKIKIGQTTFDVSGGMGPLVTLLSRIIPTSHDGQVGLWSESQNGKWTNLIAGKYGQQNGFDVLTNFFAGRLSPIAGVIRDLLKGETYQGQKPTLLNESVGLVTPMNVQTAYQATNEPNPMVGFGAWFADFLGANANPPNPTGLDLSHRDPVELELVRLGFSSRQVMPHTGNSQADEYITEELTPIADRNLRGFFASKGYAGMTDQMKQAVTKNMLAASERMAKAKVFAAHLAFFIKLRQEEAAQKHPALVGAAP